MDELTKESEIIFEQIHLNQQNQHSEIIQSSDQTPFNHEDFSEYVEIETIELFPSSIFLNYY